MSSFPAGSLTFLLTDIEGSTRLWESDAGAMKVALAHHNDILRTGIEEHGGRIVHDRGEGDSFFATFGKAADGVAAALWIQRGLATASWPQGRPIRVRMALHSGQADADEWDPVIARCARLRAVGHGGQVLLSAATEELARSSLPVGAALRDLGEHRLRDLTLPERIHQLAHPDLQAEFPPLLSLELFRHNLPIQLTTFVGRERELGELRELLGRSRLLTLTGAAGSGKTRLAVQVGAEVIEAHPDGVWLVELAPVAEPSRVAQTVAAAIRVREEPGRDLTETLIDHFRRARCLLILDNCEHLIDACAGLAVRVLQACPEVRILATSREALNVAGEQAWRAPSLDLSEAARLFIERAALVRPTFGAAGEDASAIQQICQRLDGIPLAIELAAARARLLSPGEILRRLGDRFALLTGGSRSAVARQQTLKAAVDWSYNLLSAPEAEVFRRLSVFAGGFDLAAAEKVAASGAVTEAQVLDLLERLHDRSLLQVVETAGGEPRYRLLETLRQYGREKLLEAREATEVRSRHAVHFQEMAVAAHREGDGQTVWLRRLLRDRDNFRQALEWSSAMSPTVSLRLAAALLTFWQLTGEISEGREWLLRALAQAPDADRNRATALLALGVLAIRQRDLDGARGPLEESMAIYRAIGDASGLARALNAYGLLAQEKGDEDRARVLYEESLAASRAAGDRAVTQALTHNLGLLAATRGELELAEERLREALALAEAQNDPWRTALSLGLFALVRESRGARDEARSMLRRSLILLRDLEDTGITLLTVLEECAYFAARTGEPERALRLAASAGTLRQSIGIEAGGVLSALLAGVLDEARRSLDEDDAKQAWEAGAQQGPAAALTFALEGATASQSNAARS